LLATGVNAVVEQWVTIIADTFVGTQVRMHEPRAPTQTLPELTEIRTIGLSFLRRHLLLHFQNSRFTLSIQEDRDLLGQPTDTTWNFMCGEADKDKECKPTGKNWFQPFPPSKLRQELLSSDTELTNLKLLPGTKKVNPVWDQFAGGMVHKELDEL
jgi:hypothetical protein